MKSYTIPQKMSNSGTIHDIASDMFDREIRFRDGEIFAVVNASYYGGKGYTCHRSADAAIAESRRRKEYSHRIIDVNGWRYDISENQKELFLSIPPEYVRKKEANQ